MLLLHKQEVYLPPHLLQRLHPHSLDDMHVLATVACSVPDYVSLAHSCFAMEDEQSDFDLVVCLTATAVGCLTRF